MVQDKTFEHRSIEELISIVRNDFVKLDAEGLIDPGRIVKTVMWCNEKLGLTIREIREAAIPIEEFRGELPVDFEKIYYVAALNCSNSRVVEGKNPFDNNVDQDVIYDACLNRDRLGCVDNYQVVINRKGTQITYDYGSWTPIQISPRSYSLCHIDCPNKKKLGKYEVQINEDHITTPFRTGLLYVMYVGMMKDENGQITFPFHPMITPFYEWTIKEKILSDAIFNSDGNYGELFKLAQQERVKAWLDAFEFSTSKEYGYYTKMQRRRELSWYSTYFRYFQ